MTDYLSMLDSKDIHERADAGRQLSKVGSPEHVLKLLKHAFEDRSPGVRLYSVGAAADILSRYRVGPKRKKLSKADRQAILQVFGSLDPAVNAGMFSVLANLGLPRQARRILVGLQDPRLDVRTGACVGIYRYCISSEGGADKDMRSRVLALMGSGRLRPDALGALARLCAECGWQDSRETLDGLLDREDQSASASELALDRLDQLQEPGFLAGLWMGWRADAGERTASAKPTAWMLLTEGLGLTLDADGASAFKWSSAEGGVDGQPVRRLYPPEPLTHEHGPAFQLGTDAWYETPMEAIDQLAELFPEKAEGLSASLRLQAAGAVIALLPRTVTGKKLAARVALAGGDVASARARLEALTAARKGGAEAWFWLGEACMAGGDGKAARQAFEAFLAKARKKDRRRARAEERLSEAGG